MSEDITLCVSELQERYSQSPLPSGCNIEVTLDRSRSDESAETSRRVSIVEESIFEVLHLEGDEDSSNSTIMRGMLKKNPVSPMAHVEALKTHPQPYLYPCKDTYHALPKPPSEWPQRPLMVRPTPHTSTKILGIRRASSLEYQHFSGFCAGCILPINNGKEIAGESLVIDFESTHFIGTMLLRIKQAPENRRGEPALYGEKSYFDGKKRKCQTVIRGRFKSPLPMSRCVTGQAFERPAGKLPSRWLVNAFIRFISTLAPQLEATLDGDKPRFLSPLVATAHTVLVTDPYSSDTREESTLLQLETEIEEPGSLAENSVMSCLSNDVGVVVPDTTDSSLAGRMKARKKVFNTLAAKQSMKPTFDTTKEYCFEFYQHLLDFGEELAVDMGRVGGKVGLAQATDGQPLKILAAYKNAEKNELDTLWSFDIWHESLYPLAAAAGRK